MGRHQFDKIHVIDLEATCWGGAPHPDERTEIIQIGICSLIIATGEIVNKTSLIIKPRHSTISEYCTNLTGITPVIAKGGMLFADACNKIIKDFGTRNRVWASFGVGDKEMLESEYELKMQECIEKRVKRFPFSEQYIDISMLFHIKNKLNGGCGLEDALNMYGTHFNGRPHDALMDAVNAAELLRFLI